MTLISIRRHHRMGLLEMHEAHESPLRIYDAVTDDHREVTQADIDRLVCIEQAFGALLLTLREISKPRPDCTAEDRMKIMRKIQKAIEL